VKITVYTLPDCQPCAATKRLLTRRGAAFDVVDVSTDALARELLASWGYSAAPVVHVAAVKGLVLASLATRPGVLVDTAARSARWSGFRPDALDVIAPKGAA